MSSRRSPLLPTTLESVLFAVYPLTLIAGSFFSLLDSASQGIEYDYTSQSYSPALAPSYFARKDNIFNVVFVKRGWLWITLSYFAFLVTSAANGPPFVVTPKRVKGAVRWALVTLWWIFVTQWFFGPPLIDRGFVLSGGQCELVRDAEAGKVDMNDAQMFVTSMACKSGGGEWAGGHDISGHVFLLVLGSMFLFEEVLHVILRGVNAKEERTITMRDGAVKSVEVEMQQSNDAINQGQGQWNFGVKFVMGVGILSWWMLLMTAVYFHTWFEKLTGLLVALSGVFLVFFVPRAIPALRGIVGMPGI